MITAIDTNVIVGLWDANDALHLAAFDLLEAVSSRGGVVICGAVFGELLACPGRTEEFVNRFLDDADISVDWTTNETIWKTAGRAFSAYADRHRIQKSEEPRRILADFLIGAHAFENGYSLLTLDDGIYRAAFPKLRIVRA
jgi:predicted nucleic acid-binding protein